MKKLLYFLVAILLTAGLAGLVVYNTHVGQDFLFRSVAGALLNQPAEPIDGMRVVVCGSASPLGNDPARAQACIAVLTEDHFFLFDVGARSPQRMAQARLPMGRLNAVFLTHFHSDHISALPDVNLNTWVQGRPSNLEVYGPTGVESVIAGFNQAYALDRGYRTAHHGAELLPPQTGAMAARVISPEQSAWSDGELTITAFAVAHPPIEPAVGYRIDYRGRSVVISGDSNASETLFRAAEGADLLFHDALSRTLLDPMIEIATAQNVPVLPTIMTDVIDYHADTTTLPDRAAEANIGRLVYYHLVPVPPNALAEKIFARDLPADVILARDLHTFDLPPESSEIRIREP